jgi:hypothetical protein
MADSESDDGFGWFRNLCTDKVSSTSCATIVQQILDLRTVSDDPETFIWPKFLPSVVCILSRFSFQ